MLEDTFCLWSFQYVFLGAAWVQLPCAVFGCHFRFAVRTLYIVCVFALNFQYRYRILLSFVWFLVFWFVFPFSFSLMFAVLFFFV